MTPFPTIDRPCPKCGDYPVQPFLRYQVSSSLWDRIRRRGRYALICWRCKAIIGAEDRPYPGGAA